MENNSTITGNMISKGFVAGGLDTVVNLGTNAEIGLKNYVHYVKKEPKESKFRINFYSSFSCRLFNNIFLFFLFLRNPSNFSSFHLHIFSTFCRTKIFDASVECNKRQTFMKIILFPTITTFWHLKTTYGFLSHTFPLVSDWRFLSLPPTEIAWKQLFNLIILSMLSFPLKHCIIFY